MKQHTYFPPQKVSTKEKNKQWFEDCVVAAERLVLLQTNSELVLQKKMQVWNDLYRDIIDENEIMEVLNPMQFDPESFPANIKNYPLCSPKIDLLVGEEIKRRFDWSVISRNEDSHSSYAKALKDELVSYAIQVAQNEVKDEKEIEKKVQDITKYYQYEYKELHEVTAIKILQYLWREQELKEKFTKAFKDALVFSRELYRIDVYGGKPVVIKCDPRNVFPLKRGDSYRVEDSDIIVEINYEPVGKVIDEFHEDLTPSQIDDLEAGYARSRGSGDSGVLSHLNAEPVIYSNVGIGGNIEDVNEINGMMYTYGLPFDIQGNCRILRVRWLSRRKLGSLTYFDEFGEEQVKLVPETYKPDATLGEHVKWFWVNEACEGTKLANDIFVRCRIRPIQMRHFDNPSLCFLGYVGTDYGESLMGRMEPYQYMYDVYMTRLELLLAKYKGPIYEIDISKKPDEWDLEQWMYYMEVLGFAVIDSFNEGKKGQSLGKIAGNFNTTGKVLDSNIGNVIQQYVTMLNYIEQQISNISGISEQREGQVSNRETVGGIERSVTQSSHITEKWNFMHDQTKKRVLQALLDTAKQVWSTSKSKKLSFILDDMSRMFLEFNGEDFASSEYDIFSSNATEDQEIRELMKQLSHAAVQNGASMILPIKVLKSDSIADMTKKLEIDEQERIQREQQTAEAERQSLEKLKQMDLQIAERKLELEKYKADLASYTAITVAGMKAEQVEQPEEAPEDDTAELEKIGIQKRKQSLEEKKAKDKTEFDRKALDETIRHNKAAEAISRIKKPVSTSKK